MIIKLVNETTKETRWFECETFKSAAMTDYKMLNGDGYYNLSQVPNTRLNIQDKIYNGSHTHVFYNSMEWDIFVNDIAYVLPYTEATKL